MKNLNLKKDVMARVYFIYLARRLMEPRVLHFSIFAILFIIFASSVSIPHIITNVVSSADSLGHIVGFFFLAFSHTLLITKSIILAEVLIGMVVVKDALSSFQSNRLNSQVLA
jgi:hypothetical protein